jgi:hypothetical protein
VGSAVDGVQNAVIDPVRVAARSPSSWTICPRIRSSGPRELGLIDECVRVLQGGSTNLCHTVFVGNCTQAGKVLVGDDGVRVVGVHGFEEKSEVAATVW